MSSALLERPSQTIGEIIDRATVISNLRVATADINSRWKARGKKLTSYDCQHCWESIVVRQPDPDDVGDKGCWDSLTLCTQCGGLNFVLTYPDGRTAATPV